MVAILGFYTFFSVLASHSMGPIAAQEAGASEAKPHGNSSVWPLLTMRPANYYKQIKVITMRNNNNNKKPHETCKRSYVVCSATSLLTRIMHQMACMKNTASVYKISVIVNHPPLIPGWEVNNDSLKSERVTI